MELWIARDEIGLGLYEIEPYLGGDGYWNSGGKWYEIDEKLFPEVTFENSPMEVELKLINEVVGVAESPLKNISTSKRI